MEETPHETVGLESKAEKVQDITGPPALTASEVPKPSSLTNQEGQTTLPTKPPSHPTPITDSVVEAVTLMPPLTPNHDTESVQAEVYTTTGSTTDTNVAQNTLLTSMEPTLLREPDLTSSTISTPASATPASVAAVPVAHTLHPQPKRFTAVNVNRRFLEKTTASAVPAAPAQSNKQNGIAVASSRPSAPNASASHSRLVATKLTSNPQSLHPSSGVWTRPSSASPSGSLSGGQTSSGSGLVTTGPSTGSVNQSSTTTASGSKLPGSSIKPTSQNSAGGTLKAWGATLTNPPGPASNRVQDDFPTAAEAANDKKAKLLQAHTAAEAAQESAAAQKAAQMVTADAFRGLHLDPKGHHWDEMDEDEDDFLANPIEFGDGTQYPVQPGHATPSKDATRGSTEADSLPVSKEERFGEDFDRSWPKSRGSTSTASTPFTQTTSLPPTGHDLNHRAPSSDNRALFNERSNRLEAPKLPRPDVSVEKPSAGPPPKSVWTRRKSSVASNDAIKAHLSPLPSTNGVLPTPSGSGRDLPPHTNVQLLQKVPLVSGRLGASGFPPPSLTRRGSNTYGDRESVRRESALLSPASSTGFLPPHDRDLNERGRVSRMGPPSPALTSSRLSSRDSRYEPDHAPLTLRRDPSRDGPQQPPHLGRMGPPPPPHMPPPRRPSRGMSDRPDFGAHTRRISADTISDLGRSPSISLPMAPPPPVDPFALKAPSSNDIAEFSKESMHTAAERARERRKREEEEREKDKERARHKAAELALAAENQAKAIEAEKEAQRAKEREEEAAREAAQIKVEAEAAEKQRKIQEERARVRETWRLRDIEQAKAREAAATAAKKHEAELAEKSKTTVEVAPKVEHALTSKPTPKPLSSRPPLDSLPTHPAPRSAPPRPSSWAAAVGAGRSTITPPTLPPPPPSPSTTAETWRPKPAPAPAPSLLVPPMIAELDESLQVVEGEELEEIDFSQMAEFVGKAPSVRLDQPNSVPPLVPDVTPSVDHSTEASHLASRPPLPSSEVASWRRPSETTSPEPIIPSMSTSVQQASIHEEATIVERLSPTSSPFLRRPTLNLDPSIASPPLRSPALHSPKHLFREAPMSALDDAMSRIKGVLENMQSTQDASPSQVAEGSRMAPRSGMGMTPTTSLLGRARAGAAHSSRREVLDHFAITRTSWPETSPGGSGYVRLPKRRRELEPVDKRLLLSWKMPPRPFRLDILTWDPPIEGMSRRTLSRDEILLPLASERPTVVLPFTKSTPRSFVTPSAPLPRVQLPNGPQGRWRKSPLGQDAPPIDGLLDTVSRSPPPPSPAKLQDTPKTPITRIPPRDIHESPMRGKLAPRLPAGTDVAFYRPVQQEFLSPPRASSVNFTVTSELETETPLVAEETKEAAATPAENTSNKSLFGKGSDDPPSISSSGTAQNATPSTWAKSPLVFPPISSGPSRAAPDQAHLKMVWELPSKDGVATENSLEGIADDFPTSIQFSVQDMKSDDGEGKALKVEGDTSPPPETNHPPIPTRRGSSRMSVHDAHRAFQQVPPSPSAGRGASLPSSQTPSQSNNAPQRPIGQGMSASHPHSNPRPFQAYPPPFPPGTPAVMYAPVNGYPISSPSQRMNGLPPPSTPLWMPTQPHQSGPFLRAPQPPSPYATPYSPQPMSYLPLPSNSAMAYPPGPVGKTLNGNPVMPIGRGRGGPPNGHMHSPIPGSATANPTPYGLRSPMMGAGGPPMRSAPMNYTPAPFAVPVGAGRGVPIRNNGYEPNAHGVYSSVPSANFVMRPW